MINGIYDDIKSKWDSVVDDFNLKVNQFRAAGTDLAKNRARYYRAGLGPRYEDAMNRGRMIQATIDATTGKVGEIYAWFKNAVGLGFLPALPFAAIAAATAVIGGFMVLYTGLREALDEYEIRMLPPDQQAAARQRKLSQPTLASDIKSGIWGIAAIAAIIFVLPKVLPMLQKKGR